MRVTRPIPDLAKTTIGLLRANFQRDVELIAKQTTAAMGLPEDGPDVSYDFDHGTFTYDVPDPPETVAHEQTEQSPT